MTQQEIQQLIDRYLDGETTPEEELRLAQELPEGHPVRMMLGELTLGEAEYDRIMESRQPKARTIRMTWRWAAAALAVAASLLLFFVFSHKDSESVEPQQQLIAQVVTQEEVEPKQESEETKVVEEDKEISATPVTLRENKSPRREHRTIQPKRADVALPDTLGEGIWQNEENVRIALQMLAECEATIQREEQEIRNNIVRATFNATPQPANAILVTNELGDYEVIETRTIIEI